MDKEKENTGKIQLSFKEAKDLYREYMNTGDKDKMNYLVTGTEYIVQKLSKEFFNSSKPKYDYDDIYSLTFEYYYRKLSTGSILNAKSYNDLFREEYVDFLKNNLIDTPKLQQDMPSDSTIEKIDKERLEEYADEIIRSLTEPESTALAVSNSNVPMVVEKKKSYPLTTRGFSSVVIMGIITSIICLGIIVLGVYLVI